MKSDHCTALNSICTDENAILKTADSADLAPITNKKPRSVNAETPAWKSLFKYFPSAPSTGTATSLAGYLLGQRLAKRRGAAESV